MKQVDQDFRSFFNALKAYKKDPSKFNGRPAIPHYKDKKGRGILTFNLQAISKKELKKGNILLPGLSDPIKLNVQVAGIKEARLVPGSYGYKIEVVYKIPEALISIGSYKAGMDPGVNNLATVVTNKKLAKSFIISGGPLKSINQFYNKKKSELQSELDLCKSKRGKKSLKNKLYLLDSKRYNKIEDYLHKSSRVLVNQLVSAGVNELVIGHNPEWKQEAGMGTVSNQNFCMMPHDLFFKKIEYKSELLGIVVQHQKESYTSKCSFLDMEDIQKQEVYKGKRLKRGVFKSSSGVRINADANGAGNILRKGISGAFDLWSDAELIEGFVVNPVRLVVDPVRSAGKDFYGQRCL
jgi:IS605 OrfB family transposase